MSPSCFVSGGMGFLSATNYTESAPPHLHPITRDDLLDISFHHGNDVADHIPTPKNPEFLSEELDLKIGRIGQIVEATVINKDKKRRKKK